MDHRPLSVAAFAALCLSACASSPPAPAFRSETVGDWTVHRGDDDLLAAGLGEAGLRSPVAPVFADADAPTPTELRRRAVWTNWRGIADLAPGGGYGTVYGTFAPVPGREMRGFARVAGARQQHRVLLQVPDAFDRGQRCVVVAPSSGSRGVYGAIALAGGWGLPRGCAVAYTDKGAGTGYVDLADGVGRNLDGARAAAGEPVEYAVAADASAPPAVAVKHAHSGDNPEAAWGEHVRQAARFALQGLDAAFPDAAPFTAANTRVIALGVSNGGGAVLRAAEVDDGLFDAVVAVSPNINAPAARPLYDYATQAALLLPCALAAPAFDAAPMARGAGGVVPPPGLARCASLHDAGLFEAVDAPAQALEAGAKLRAGGWTDAALASAALSTTFDLWRAIGATYASAYARTDATHMPCGFRLSATTPTGALRAPTVAERAAWWSDASGIPPGAGVGLVDTLATPGADPTFAGLRCLRALWEGEGDTAATLHASVEALTARAPAPGVPVLVIHGREDGLIPAAFTSDGYIAAFAASRPLLRHWDVAHAQHFDAFLGLPPMAARYVPMLPIGWRGMDAIWAHVAEGAPLPASGAIETTPRAVTATGITPLHASDLGSPPAQ
ncbi:MAG: 3-hydroxybutyrate oligomer hydrolase family protein [Arenimonas sp.]